MIQTRSGATEFGPDIRTPAREEAPLLRDVRRRASSVLALVSSRTWPYAELRTLTGFLRTAVLPQEPGQELFSNPDGTSSWAGEPRAADDLATLIDLLDQVDPSFCSLTALHRLVTELLGELELRVIAEQQPADRRA